MRDLIEVLDSLEQKLDAYQAGRARHGSRFVGQAADAETVKHLAAGGQLGNLPAGWKTLPATRATRGRIAPALKALAEGTGSAGGYLVPVEVANEVVMAIRARSAVMRMGPRVVPVEKELDITSLSTGASAAYVGENAAIPVSEETFVQAVLLRPKELAALVPVSNRLLRDAADNPAVEDVVRADLAEIMALRADLAFLRGTGVGGEPVGIRNIAGTTPGPSLGANGRTPTFDDLKDVAAGLRALNAPFSRPGWIFHPRLLSTLEKVKDADGRYLAETELLTFDATGGGGRLLGFPFVTTSQIPINLTTGSSTDTTEIYFSSDWNEVWVGENDELRIELSGEASYTADGGATWVSAFQNRQTLFRSTWAHDIGLRRPAFVSVTTGARP